MKAHKKVMKKFKKMFFVCRTNDAVEINIDEIKSDEIKSDEIKSDASTSTQNSQEYELRSLEAFREIQITVENNAGEEDERTLDSQFKDILLAATELIAEIKMVNNEIAPFFFPDWAIETIWSTFIAHTSSDQNIQKTDSSDLKSLFELGVVELLNLVAWVEYFWEQVEEAFPNCVELKSSIKEYFELRLDFLTEDEKEVDVDFIANSVMWVNDVLLEAHRLVQEELLSKTKNDAEQWLSNVYAIDHTKSQTYEGHLNSSLCEDVFCFFHIQLDTFRKHLSSKSDTLVKTILLIFSCMRSKQLYYRSSFLQDLETCCMAANNFTRMSEKCEDNLNLLIQECHFTEKDVATLKARKSELLEIYTNDAVYAAQFVHIYIFEPINETIGEMMFGIEWEDNLTDNELALALVHTLEDNIADLKQFLDPTLLKKLMEALVSATVIFYIRHLLTKAQNHSTVKEPYFKRLNRSVMRIMWDTRIMREFFDDLSDESQFLSRAIKREFEILNILPEIMNVAAGSSSTDLSDFILLVHKKVANVNLTKCFFGDLWHLVNPTKEQEVLDIVDSMESELRAFDVAKADCQSDQSYVPGLRLNEMIAELCMQSKRQVPITANVLEKIDGMKQKFKENEEKFEKKMKQTFKGSEVKIEKMIKTFKDLNQISDKFKMSPQLLKLAQPSLKVPRHNFAFI